MRSVLPFKTIDQMLHISDQKFIDDTQGIGIRGSIKI